MPPRKLKLLIALIEMSGGTGVFCRNLADGLREYFPGEFELGLLVMRSGSTDGADDARFDRIHTIDLSVHDDWRRFLETIPNALKLRKALKHIDADVIFTLHNYPSLIIRAVAPRRRIVLSVHGHLSTLLRRNITRPFVRWLIRRRYRGRLVIVPTRGVAEDLAENFGVTTARVIHHGVDLDRLHRLADERPDDLPERPYIISLGRLVREKDYPTLLRAYAEACVAGLEHHLVIIGSGELDAELKQLARSLGIADRTHFLGHLDNPYPYLKHAGFFVLPSLSEGFGLALVEAMALGLPCIATDCPSGPAEILGHGESGIIVPTGSPSDLADATLKLARSPELRAELSAKAVARARQFTLEKMAGQYRDLFLQKSG
jgi:N-acetylgalactosamine-N,N'-diacetylbacillosaminyl-diphospho-undecaprenol 4-alpha-N-acetylgalactosaminyltransferase